MAEEHDDELLHLRKLAYAVAYRMLGAVTDAEDITQEALLRVHATRRAGTYIESPRAYVTAVATRLAIDRLRSTRVRREEYVGEWLPEPRIDDEDEALTSQADLTDSLSLAFLVLLERLTPEQRAVLLLRDVFDYEYARIAEIIGKRESNTRQIAARARRFVDERRPRFEASADARDRLARQFFAAIQSGDRTELEALLAHDVALHGDGGGKAPALARPIHGRSRVANTLMAWAALASRIDGLELDPIHVNGQPGARFVHRSHGLLNVIALDITDGQITTIRSIVNPEKLRHLGPVADAAALLASANQRRAAGREQQG